MTATRTMPRTKAAASSQWRTPVRRQLSESLSAAQSGVTAFAVAAKKSANVAMEAVYLFVAMRFRKNPCTFDLRC